MKIFISIPVIGSPLLKNILACCCLIVLTACSPKNEQAVLVFDYDDFGPSALSYSVIGSPWWQWLPHGDGNPETKYAIKVLVHKYPDYQSPPQYSVSEQEKRDFRIIGCQDALGYIDVAMPMAREMGITGNKSLGKLEQVKQKLVKYCD